MRGRRHGLGHDLRGVPRLTHTHEADLDLAHHLADVAGDAAMVHYLAGVTSRDKHDGSPVTDADLAVEDLIRGILATERPGDAMLGEERGQTGTGPRRWIVDAIDGTRSFAARRPQWATLLALEVGGEVVLGMASGPAMGVRRWAVRGGGAWRATLDDPDAPVVPLVVSHVDELSRARVRVLGSPIEGRAEAALRALGSPRSPGQFRDHPALEVASGMIDVSVHLSGGPWDHAAMVVIVEEAGGRFTDLHGGRRLDTATALFTNGHLHDAVLARLNPHPVT